MRNFFYRVCKNIIWIYVCFVFVLSYRLIYNEIYVFIDHGVETGASNETWVHPSGEIVGIYTECNGVFVIDTCEVETAGGEYVGPAIDCVKKGDYILEINNQKIFSKEEMIQIVKKSAGSPLLLKISRNNEVFEREVTPVLGKKGDYLLGIWVKDDLAGVGTLTFVKPDGEFAALGHGMSDGETSELLDVKRGDLYVSNIVGIEKGERGDPGEIKGIISYGVLNHIGEVSENSKKGIYGQLDKEDIKKYTMFQAYPIASKKEIEEGFAQIISEIDGERKLYDIRITYVDYLATNTNKGIHIEVVDEELIRLTGGIIQGMSGSPILQNGKIIGAVTHVLINDPKSGYGIFIENMIE